MFVFCSTNIQPTFVVKTEPETELYEGGESYFVSVLTVKAGWTLLILLEVLLIWCDTTLFRVGHKRWKGLKLPKL